MCIDIKSSQKIWKKTIIYGYDLKFNLEGYFLLKQKKKKKMEGNLGTKQNSNFVQKLVYKIILLEGMTSWSYSKSNMLIK